MLQITSVIAYSLSLFPGPQTLSDFFSKVCEDIVMCNECAVHLLYENVFGLKV